MLENGLDAQTAQDSAREVRWALTSLYSGPDDPALAEDSRRSLELAREFSSRWKARVAELSPEDAGRMLLEHEQGSLLQWKIASWTSLAYSADARNEAVGGALAHARELFSQIEAETSFLQVEIAALPDSTVERWLDEIGRAHV